ncbi:MAG: hypothetical protein U5R14_12495 [Gemmatimonadota bacterium]|nr:hypothetical protein [Gemmatimonadota bacterium]
MHADPAPTDPIYRFTALGRRLDPDEPTNLAVLWSMPVGALIVAVLAPMLPGLTGTPRLLAAGEGAAVVLGTWALGRELAPDDPRAAFFALALGFAVLLAVPDGSIVLLFATLLLVRIVNRSVGLAPRTIDGILAMVLVGWAIFVTKSYGVGLVAAVAFGLDARLEGGRRRQWGFAGLCLLMVGILASTQLSRIPLHATEVELAVPARAVLVAVLVTVALFVRTIVRTGTLASVADATAEPLSPRRIRFGMGIALLMAAQSLTLGDTGARHGGFLWACLAGVAVSSIAPPGTGPDGA